MPEIRMAKNTEITAGSFTLDLRGTTYQGQLGFLLKMNELASPEETLEILTCDELTLEHRDSWLTPDYYELLAVIKEKGYYRIQVKLRADPNSSRSLK